MSSPQSNSPKASSTPGSPTHPITSNIPIEADVPLPVDDDIDAGYESEQASTGSTSLSSSIQAHTFEDGIRYHRFRDGKYAFPNDANEQNRDDMKHAMTVMLSGDRLHFAPIGDHPQNILDLGKHSLSGRWIWLQAYLTCVRYGNGDLGY